MIMKWYIHTNGSGMTWEYGCIRVMHIYEHWHIYIYMKYE